MLRHIFCPDGVASPGYNDKMPSPLEYIVPYTNEGNIYKNPIYINSDETNNVPAIKQLVSNSNPCPEGRNNANGKLTHLGLLPNHTNCATVQKDVSDKKPKDEPQDLKSEIKSENELPQKKKRLPTFIEDIDYQLLKGKQGIELLTAIELQTNKNLSKLEFHLGTSSDSTVESPRKVRTRSVESAVRYPEDRRKRGVKRPRSIETGPAKAHEVPAKISRLSKNEQKDHKAKDKERRSDHKRRKSHRTSIGIQARPSRDHGRHYLKLLEPRPALMASGNYTYPPSDVSNFFCLFMGSGL